ncbi:MAG: AraC family transcriptional regulator [Alphaproteobacteria bacterium]|nr:MAG: AraC family transcriptional regulator [Alphaproteobacteria bacterium]
MFDFNVLSVTLLASAGQGVVLACLLVTQQLNVTANRSLAALIVAVAVYMTPYIIGYAGVYDRWPWLSFAPFDVTLIFGPLFYWHTLALTGGRLGKFWTAHFAPFALQFLSQAIIFPWPLSFKNWWNAIAHERFIDPFFAAATFVSLAMYGWLSWRRYQTYRDWLRDNRADGERFDPAWIRNALFAVAAIGTIWAGFAIANALDPARDYFDQFWLYVGFGLLAIYLGVEGWRNANHIFPSMTEPSPPEAPISPVERPVAERDWAEQGAAWAGDIERLELWRDPDISLAKMARALGANTAYVSKALNEGLDVSFHDFVNGRRVEALKRLLADPSEVRDLMSLAFDVGFKSKASFNRVFSDVVRMTPSAFRRAARLKQ